MKHVVIRHVYDCWNVMPIFLIELASIPGIV
jgi:hypothetical protein